jgi:hypothetical protein
VIKKVLLDELRIPETYLVGRFGRQVSLPETNRKIFGETNDSLDRLQKKKDSTSRADLIILLKRLRSSEKGLHVYERTYGDDVTLCARICRLREQVRLRAGFPRALATETTEDKESLGIASSSVRLTDLS